MRITPAAHIEKMSGASGDLVFVQLSNGTCYARQRPCRRHKRHATDEQIQMQKYTGQASANWINLADWQRRGWEDYAKQYMHKDRKGRPVRPNAVAMYVRANMTRQILGLPLLFNPPTKVGPNPILIMVDIAVSDPRTVELRIVHSYPDADLSDHVVLVRMAPPPVTDARRFQASDFRYICQSTAASAQSLPVSGENVIFSPTRFEVPPGKRFMIEVRVARLSDGMLSAPTEAEFRKP